MPKLDRTALPVTAVHDAPIPMRDGTILRADIQHPAEGGPVPTLLVRNPYGEQMNRSLPVVPALEASSSSSPTNRHRPRRPGTTPSAATFLARRCDAGVTRSG